MKNILLTIAKFIAIFICLNILYNALLYLSCSFSSDFIYDNCLKSAYKLKEQTDYPEGTFGVQPDNAMSALVINTIYSIDSNDPVKSYMLARKNYKPGLTKVELGDRERRTCYIYQQ